MPPSSVLLEIIYRDISLVCNHLPFPFNDPIMKSAGTSFTTNSSGSRPAAAQSEDSDSPRSLSDNL